MVFDESKIINALHKDKAEIGKKYYFADALITLKDVVENEDISWLYKLEEVTGDRFPFRRGDCCYQLLYPYEEPPKKRMTNRQLAEWLAKGNGEWSMGDCPNAFVRFEYDIGETYKEVDDDIIICRWDSDEWVEPTVDIYERDCKGE